jgi:hypothetical protein
MGIDLYVKSSLTVDNLFDDPLDYYLKFAFRDINENAVYRLLNLNLEVLYGHGINYWSYDHIVNILKLLNNVAGVDGSLAEYEYNCTQEWFSGEPMTPEWKQDILHSLPTMIEYFKKLVDAKDTSGAITLPTIHVF